MALAHTCSKLNNKATVKKRAGTYHGHPEGCFQVSDPCKEKKNYTLEINSDFVIILTTGTEH